MTNKKIIPLLLAAILATSAAHATVSLLAVGTLSGSADLSSQTSGLLENGVAGNILGGMGSGFAWAGGNTFIATPDRGPNATAYNSLVDDTTSYISRFQTLNMSLTQNAPGATYAYSLAPTLIATTLLSSATALTYGSGADVGLGSGAPVLNAINGTNYFTGRSDNFDPSLSSGNLNNARLDPEGVRVSNDGKSIFVSDEYGPYIYQFDRATGQRIKSFTLPSNLDITKLSAQGGVEIASNAVGRVSNKGMEGLAITPDGKTLVGIMQAPLEQDTNKIVRIVTIDIASGTTHEYAYKLTTGSGVSEIVALNDHQFVVDERDGKGLGDGSTAVAKQLFKIDLTGAQDVTSLSGDLSLKAVPKVLFADLVALMNAKGIASSQIPSKIEGLAFGDDLIVDGLVTHTLYVTNDNDFVSAVAGDNKFFVFGFTDADLARLGASFTEQAIADVPEPNSCAMLLLGLGVMGVAARRRSRK
ncbi:MAG: sorting protein [Rhodocyclales bacterium]|nr:sorting protein [Rhodocyclales bacterium]MDB5887752.1 sorting protein [Rhodocyclales bacterium]